ncbi:TetR family transcriptional regulator [Nonomuraea soli]|uniref:AcrR family transcriptional regulator n=1 Tax=Nonomuraea soli TaxID=1032476 RepID=A0A7W0CD54_9ACTN|nr:TetR family transcriptional regulator [Nonomuraea soli]MBA2888964.1 AcrR family transcriptional regulator [Nonomuraea soli]
MSDGVLTREQILAAAQDVLRRYGPAKATVVDVARALGVSHGSVYRHFPSKAALREAVTHQWLEQSHAALAVIPDGPAPVRLRAWLSALFTAKRKKVLDDPELFATYTVLVGESSTVIAAHIDELVGQLEEIVAAGVERGELATADARSAARAVFDATARFHDPAHAAEWSDPAIDAQFEAVCDLLISGLVRHARP